MELGILLILALVVVIGFLNQIAILRRLERVYPDLWERLGRPSLKNNTIGNGLRTSLEMLRCRPPFSNDTELRTRALVQIFLIVVMFAIALVVFLVIE
jgi:hypothetical protein